MALLGHEIYEVGGFSGLLSMEDLMKSLTLVFAVLSIAAATLTSSLARANGTVCAGPNLHYVDDYHVLGIPPPDGFMYHEAFLTSKGKLLAHVRHFQNKPSVGAFEWNVQKTNEMTLAKQGNQSAGWRVYSATLTVQLGTNQSTKIVDLVTCKDTWAIVP